MVAEQQYRYLVDQVYWVDNLRSENSPKENEVYYYSNKNPKLGQFQVLKTKDNTSNGMQAMAVAPVDKNGNVDDSHVVIAYAGTN
nr:hypothetical protein [Streptococcus oralis]